MNELDNFDLVRLGRRLGIKIVVVPKSDVDRLYPNMIINLDDDKGTHWVALSKKGRKVVYFDGFFTCASTLGGGSTSTLATTNCSSSWFWLPNFSTSMAVNNSGNASKTFGFNVAETQPIELYFVASSSTVAINLTAGNTAGVVVTAAGILTAT